MQTSIQADAKFLRRVLMTLIVLTVAAGAMVAFTTAQATPEIHSQTPTTE